MSRLPVASYYGLAAVLLVATSWGGAQTPAPSLRLLAVNAERAEQVEALVELAPGTNATTAQSFAFIEDGVTTSRATAVAPFRAAGWTLTAVLAVDTSGSVSKVLPAIAGAAPPFVMKLPDRDAIALITFDDHVHEQAPFGTPRTQVATSLQTLKPHGRRTLLNQALTQSLDLVQKNGGARSARRVMIVSDGVDVSTDEANVLDAIINRAADARIAIDTIWVGQPVASRRNTLVRMAERTGGIHTDALDPATMQAAIAAGLAAIAARVEAWQVVTFQRTIDPSRTTRSVGVTLPDMAIAPALLAMQIAGTAPPAAAGTPWWVVALLALLGAYVLYAIAYALVLWLAPDHLGLFPFRPWPSLAAPQPVVIPDPEPEPPRGRRGHTRVGRYATEPRGATAGGVLVLEATAGPLKGQRIPVGHNNFQIGAGTDNDLRIAADVHLSSTHALFETVKGHWFVRDQDSSNGTFIDGQRLDAGRSYELAAGQVLRAGASEFRIALGEAARAASPTIDSEPLR